MLYDDGRNVRLLYELEVPVYPQEAQEELGVYKTGDYAIQVRVGSEDPPGFAICDAAGGPLWAPAAFAFAMHIAFEGMLACQHSSAQKVLRSLPSVCICAALTRKLPRRFQAMGAVAGVQHLRHSVEVAEGCS